jgi:predicted alpha/beta superfamily hydrolase
MESNNINKYITKELTIEGIKCHIYYYENTPINKVIYWIENFSIKAPEILTTLTNVKNYFIIGISIDDWNTNLTPWYCPRLFGKKNNDFKGEGQKTFDWLINNCIANIEKEFADIFDKNKISRYLAGYSLSALFSLWVFYSDKNKKEKIFDGVGACSPSLWYKKWDEYMKDRGAPEESMVYLSLGDKEGHTKNETFQKMRSGMDEMIEMVKNDKGVKKYFYEEHKGGHYENADLRMAKAFKWLIEN